MRFIAISRSGNWWRIAVHLIVLRGSALKFVKTEIVLAPSGESWLNPQYRYAAVLKLALKRLL